MAPSGWRRPWPWRNDGRSARRDDPPVNVLVLNAGSSSLKYRFRAAPDETRSADGSIERIDTGPALLRQRGPGGEVRREVAGSGYEPAFQAMLEELVAERTGVLRDLREVQVVGHRVVHGGAFFDRPVLIDDEVLRRIEALGPLAPLHNPVNAATIRRALDAFPGVPQVAVFDTAFHQTLPPRAYHYGLPTEFLSGRVVRRYGFHGQSHAYVAEAAAACLRRSGAELSIISCHLGNGASVCAIQNGRSIDTSMGFTPGEGLLMGTRAGDLDAGILTYLQREHGFTGAQIDHLLNKQSGLLGVSGLSGDMREIVAAAAAGHERAALALELFCYRLRKYLGAYLAVLGGLDAIVFTGGIGQGSARVRALTLQGLERLGIRLDAAANESAPGFREICSISTADSPVAVLVVPADEEGMIAREAIRVAGLS